MSAIPRSWVAFAAVGAGLIHLALALTADPGLAIPLVLFGFAEFAWGVLAFARETLIAPRVAMVTVLVPTVAWVALLAVAPGAASSLGFLPLAVAALFAFFVAIMIAVSLRRATDAAPPQPTIARFLVGILVGAAVVAGLTAPAIAATEAGGSSVPDTFFEPDHGH